MVYTGTRRHERHPTHVNPTPVPPPSALPVTSGLDVRIHYSFSSPDSSTSARIFRSHCAKLKMAYKCTQLVGPRALLLHLATLLLLALSTTSTSTTTRTAPSPTRRLIQPRFSPLHVLSAVFATSPTHVTAPLEISRVLAARGHRITWVATADSIGWVGSAEERAQLPFTFVQSSAPSVNSTVMTGLIDGLKNEGVKGLDTASKMWFESLYEPTFHDILALVEQDRPDVMVCDLFSHTCTDIADKLSIPFVMTFPGGLGDFGLGDGYDTPNQFTGYSQQWHQQPIWHRIWNTYFSVPYVIYHLSAVEGRFNQLRAKFDVAPNVTPLDKWEGHDVIFNGNWGWDYSKPLPPYFHLLGPIVRSAQGNANDVNKMTPALRTWLDESERQRVPVIYMALGSLAWLTEREQSTFQRAFSSCPASPLSSSGALNSSHTWQSTGGPHFRVVWQSNKPLAETVRAALPDTVREERWVAQPAVLAHPAVALFVTHVGSSSLQEGIAVGLPLLAVPFFGDQPANAIRVQDAGVALKIDHKTMTADELCHKIRHLVYDPEVRANVDRLQRIYHLTTDGATRGADVVERAAYVGTQHLIPYRERRDVSAVIRYNLDVYALGVGVVALLLYAAYRVLAALVGVALVLAGVGARRKSKVA